MHQKIINILGIQICAIFLLALVVVEFGAILRFYTKIKVAKHIWEPCCHLVVETGS
jgi:hypothetical protein